MTHRVFGMVMAILLLAGVTPGWSQQSYLYAPKAVAVEEKVQKKDGVLVQEVPVKRGDTLYGISRRFSGHGSYYPQILLFNEINDPNKIYTGDVLRIPVSRSGVTGRAADTPAERQVPSISTAGPASDIPAVELNTSAAKEEKIRVLKHKAAPPAKRARSAAQPTAAVAVSAEQRLFERAIKAYRQDDYRTALELFDRFLADHPASALAADASLYKAECYLKQSNQ